MQALRLHALVLQALVLQALLLQAITVILDAQRIAYYLREPPRSSTYRILPPRRAAGENLYTTFAKIPEAQLVAYYLQARRPAGRPRATSRQTSRAMSRDVRPPTGAAAGAAAGEKSLAGPSHSGIIAHSFARTHDTYTKTKPKSISRLDSPPPTSNTP